MWMMMMMIMKIGDDNGIMTASMMTMIMMDDDDDDDYDDEVHPPINLPYQFYLKSRIEMFLEATVLFSTARLVCVNKRKGQNPYLLNAVCYTYINQL